MCGVCVHICAEVGGRRNSAESGVDTRTNSFHCAWRKRESGQLFPRSALTLKNHCRKQQRMWKTEVAFHGLWDCSQPSRDFGQKTPLAHPRLLDYHVLQTMYSKGLKS